MPDNQNQETIIYTGRLHWIIYFWTIFWGLIWLMLYFSPNTDGKNEACGVVLIIPVILFITTLIKQLTQEFRITNKRILIKKGLIARQTSEIPLQKIESVNVKQGIIGRIVNAGDLEITGVGSKHEPFRPLNAPTTFRDKLVAAMDRQRTI